MDVVEKIVDIEKILFAIRFPANGSLYFKESLGANIMTADISPDVSHGKTDKFCIGPSTELLWWYQRRDELTVNRGPCKRPLIYAGLKYLILRCRENFRGPIKGCWSERDDLASKIRRATFSP